VRIWDPATGQPVGEPLTGHDGPVHGVCALPGRDPGGPTVLATTGGDGTVRIWNAASGLPVGEPLVAVADSLRNLTPCAASLGDCIGVTGDGGLRTWTAATASLAVLPTSEHATAVAVLANVDHDVLITADAAGLVHVADLATRRILRPPVRTGTGAVLALCPLPDRPARVSAAGRDGTITIFTPAAGRAPERVLHAHRGPVRALCLVDRPGDSPLLASAGNDATIRFWDCATWMPHGNPAKGHDGWIWSITSIPAQAGQAAPRLASAGADSIIRMWDPLSGEQIGQPLIGHADQVRAVICAIAVDGRSLLISGGHDGTVRLWNPRDGALLHTIPLRIPVHSLLQRGPDDNSLKRTDGGATITVGLRAGILALDLHSSLFPDM
jgi:WD40 repeat protein